MQRTEQQQEVGWKSRAGGRCLICGLPLFSLMEAPSHFYPPIDNTPHAHSTHPTGTACFPHHRPPRGPPLLPSHGSKLHAVHGSPFVFPPLGRSRVPPPPPGSDSHLVLYITGRVYKPQWRALGHDSAVSPALFFSSLVRTLSPFSLSASDGPWRFSSAPALSVHFARAEL